MKDRPEVHYTPEAIIDALRSGEKCLDAQGRILNAMTGEQRVLPGTHSSLRSAAERAAYQADLLEDLAEVTEERPQLQEQMIDALNGIAPRSFAELE